MKNVFVLFLMLSASTQAQQPTFEGGLENFLSRNKIYPTYALQNCIEGQITVAFKLNNAGEIYFSKVQEGLGTDLDEEALRLIRLSSGNWQVPENHDTTKVLLAPINFRLSGYDCASKSKPYIAQAIAAYRNRQNLTAAIRNFYKNKLKGNAVSETEEARIRTIKAELGYDDAYLQQRLNEAERKFQQGDTQGACEDFYFIREMGSTIADDLIHKHCVKQ